MATASSVATADSVSSSSVSAAMTTTMPAAMSPADKIWFGRETTNPEYRGRKKPAVQSVQRGNLLVIRFGGILRSVIFVLARHLVAIEFALVPFVHAGAKVRVVVPVDRA